MASTILIKALAFATTFQALGTVAFVPPSLALRRARSSEPGRSVKLSASFLSIFASVSPVLDDNELREVSVCCGWNGAWHVYSDQQMKMPTLDDNFSLQPQVFFADAFFLSDGGAEITEDSRARLERDQVP